MYCLFLSVDFFRLVPWRSTLAAATLALSVNLVGLDGRARAASLEGLEPIKFGMTMEEAKAALSDQAARPKSEGFFDHRAETVFDKTSLQTYGNFMAYKIFIESMKLRFDVYHRFTEGRAEEVTLNSPVQRRGLERCTAAGRILARGIEKNHGVSPKYRPGELEESFPMSALGRKQVIENYVIVFEHGASIRLKVWWMSGGSCSHSIYYRPPDSGIALF